MITVDEAAENTIVLSPGANLRCRASQIPVDAFASGGLLMLQMEVSKTESFAAARMAKAAGASVILSLAPFEALARDAFDDISILLVNETEAADLAGHYGVSGARHDEVAQALAGYLGVTVIATLGADGAVASESGGDVIRVSSPAITPVDTTGAGDTFAGVLAAGLDAGEDLARAMGRAAVAGALACTKEGAQPSFPTKAEIDELLAEFAN